MRTNFNPITRLYSRTCPNCNNDFAGTKRMKFCKEQCRIDFNNDKAAQKKKESDTPVHRVAMAFEKNCKILYELFENTITVVSLKTLVLKGFDMDAPFNTVSEQRPNCVLRRYWRILLCENEVSGVFTLEYYSMRNGKKKYPRMN
ncbi:MAG: hypothetical protein IPP69_07955 [Flavobacteriales bacterium]|nr:hypothetical protein [Flavobacteriales bacterium]